MNRKNIQVALITGAARRIGASITKHLHQAGFNVAIHCHHSRDEAEHLCRTLNQKRANSARVFFADLTQQMENQSLITHVIEWAGRLDLLVNNASLFEKSDVLSLDSSVLDKLFSINVQAPYWLSLAARAHLSEQQGVIINITDIHAETPLKGYAEYCQTKAAFLMQTKAFALEFAPTIRVNAVAPGAIAWPEGENHLNPIQQETIIAKTLLKRHGESAFIAQAVLQLVQNPFITGQTLRVDGGRLI